jgi:uncharacterized protein (UPF0332 family)
MTDAYHEHIKEIDALLKMSRQNLLDAQTLLKSEGYRSAISRAYYMFLDLAKAALLTKGIVTQSHVGAVKKFGEILVKPGIIKGNYGRAFRRALETRLEADYEALREFTQEDAEELIKEAEEFYNELQDKIFKE